MSAMWSGATKTTCATVSLAVFLILIGTQILFAQVNEFETPIEQQSHTWTDSKGTYTVEAVFVEYGNKIVKLKKSDGEIIDVRYSKLGTKSKTLAKKLQKIITRAKKKASAENKKAKNGNRERGAAKADDEDADDEIPNATGPPNPRCPRCHGDGLVGTKTFKPWIITTEADAKEMNSQPVGESCPICQKGIDPIVNSLPYTADLDAIVKNHFQWTDDLGFPLQMLQTRFVVIHSQLEEHESLMLARAIEGFEWKQQQTFGSLHFSNRRRAQDELFVFTDRPSFSRYIDLLKPMAPDRDWESVKQLAFSNHFAMGFQQRQETLEHIVGSAVYGTASMQISRAAGWNGGPWLRVGFAAHFEKVVTFGNRCYMSGSITLDRSTNSKLNDEIGFGTIDPNQNQGGNKTKVKLRQMEFNGDWDVGVTQLARANGLLPWDQMMHTKLVDFELQHDLQSKAMIDYLVLRPDLFVNFVDLLGIGTHQVKALEEAYGKTIEELEANWLKWLN